MDRIAEALEVIDLALAEVFDGVADVGIVDEAQDIVVGDACLLFGGEVLVQVCEGGSLDGEIRGGEGDACGGDGVDACGMVDEIGVESRLFDLLGREVFGQLVEDGGDHFHVCELLGADVGEDTDDIAVRHGIALVEVTQCRAELAVGTAEVFFMMIKKGHPSGMSFYFRSH